MEPWHALRRDDSTQSIAAIAIVEGTGTIIIDGWIDGFDRPFMAAIRSASGVVRIPTLDRVRVRIDDAVGLVALVDLLSMEADSATTNEAP